MAAIAFTPFPNSMGGSISNVPAFPGEGFSVGIPEAIGETARSYWFGAITPEWHDLGGGTWESVGRVEGQLRYVARITPSDDFVDVLVTLTNESEQTWDQSHAFNCFSCGGAPSVADRECVRHWVRRDGRLRRLIEVPRQYGPRPTVQLYSVEGAPRAADIPFVAAFQATPADVVLEGWMAILARDGRRLVAAASKPTLYLFQNMEYSCIHAAPSLGRLDPGQTGEALTRLYFVKATLEDWRQRMLRDLS